MVIQLKKLNLMTPLLEGVLSKVTRNSSLTESQHELCEPAFGVGANET